MYSIAHYIENLQNTVADYVATHLFLTFARNQSGLMGSSFSRRWWDQVDQVFSNEDTSDDVDFVI